MKAKNEMFRSIRPNNELLSKYIQHYYLHTSTNPQFYKNVVYHPHYWTVINIYKDTRVELSDFGRTYIPSTSEALCTTYTINNKTSKEVRMRGRFDKIGIVFRPLGLNHFIDQPLSDVISKNISYFDYFGDDLSLLSSEVFSEKTIEEKRDVLDMYFLNRFSVFNDVRIITAVDHIFNSENILSTYKIAQSLSISRETLLRLFKKHLYYTVEEFKSVVRFRRALEYYEEKEIKPKLTKVAVDNQYYDQADFIKHFRKITGYSPKKFFSSLRNISNSGTYWTFKD